MSDVAWQFNEAVSLLREARRIYVPDGSTLAAEIDDGLPLIQAALEAAAAIVAERALADDLADQLIRIITITEWDERDGRAEAVLARYRETRQR